MKKLFSTIVALTATIAMLAQGWPAQYDGVMLQGFYWDSYSDTKWTKLTNQADELARYFDLIWIPQSGNCGGTSMGYNPMYQFTDYNSSFGNEQQLRTMINTFKAKGLGTIADVVINHHKDTKDWVVFQREEYNGKVYELLSTDVCKNDDGGKTKAFCDTKGWSMSANNDTGEDWDGFRDLDHNSANVQYYCNGYIDFLLNDLGYTGLRYDMVKGYASRFTGMYNSQNAVQFSVGENWDGYWPNLKTWIDGTKVDGVIQSAAFDFPFRYTARDVVNNKDWRKLADQSLARQSAYSRYAVTFIENHDTERRADGSGDPLKGDTLALNAFMMSMPGTPCVFLKHWQAYKPQIKQMIDVRKAVGVHNMSRSTTLASNQNYFIAQTATTNSGKKMIVACGTVPADVLEFRTAGYTCVASGYHYKMYMQNEMETAWVDTPSCEFTDPITVTLLAVTATGQQLVYSTDGGTTWKNANSGTQLTISETTTLKVALQNGSTRSGEITREYTLKTIEPFDPYDVTVYVKDPTAAPHNWTSVYFWAWDDKQVSTTSKSWPGDDMTNTPTKTIKGDKFFYRSFTITDRDYTFGFIFSQKGSPQTIDITDINRDIYLELGAKGADGKYGYVDVTDKYSGGDVPVMGDVNGDGVVDIADVNCCINVILGSEPASKYEGRADVNGDGTVDIADVNAIINIIRG